MSKSHTKQPDVDEFLYHYLIKAQKLPEGNLSPDKVKAFYGFHNDAQLVDWLKSCSKFPYQISPSGEVRLQFTKHEITADIKDEFFRIRRQYIHVNTPEPEWFQSCLRPQPRPSNYIISITFLIPISCQNLESEYDEF